MNIKTIVIFFKFHEEQGTP